MHKGPFNMRCVSQKHPKFLIQEILKTVYEQKFNYKNVKNNLKNNRFQNLNSNVLKMI